MHNTPGQGRKTKLTESETERLVYYLSTNPEHKAGVVKWPSCAFLADNEALQLRLRIPKADESTYRQVALKAGCTYLLLYCQSRLSPGMVKRRLATAKKYRKRTEQCWKEKAFQDESNVELWQRGPPKRWFREEY